MPNSKRTKQGAFAILIALLMMLSLVANVGAVVKDLTPAYRKAGSLIDVLSWDIYGPAGGTSLTQITFWYTGTNATSDMEWVQFYANSTLLGTVYQVGAVIFNPAYAIAAGDMVTITMKIKIADTGVHGNHVDGRIENYVLSKPGAPGTDNVPANPAGYTIIDNLRPAVVSAWAVPDPAKDGSVKVTVLFNDTMLYDSPNVSITGLTGIYNDIGQDSYATTTFTNDTWIGTFDLDDDDEEKTATISVEDGEDMATNVMLANYSAGTFKVDTVNPAVNAYAVSDLLITEADVGDPFWVQVRYNEAMNTSVNPSVSFNKAVSGTLSPTGGAWSIAGSQYFYRATYTILDGNQEVDDVDTTWTGAEDLAGNTQVSYTSSYPFDIDTKEPTVDDIAVSDLNITEADVGDFFYVAMNFSETMNTAVAPTIEFIPDVSSTLTFNSGAWDLSDTRYTANYTIVDDDETEYGVDVTVSKAEDLAGNEDPLTEYDMFDVDTVKPTVVSATAVPNPAKEGTVTVTVVFSETMDTTTSPTVNVTNLSGPDYQVSGSFTSGTTWVGTFTLLDNEEEATAYISVTGGKDARGNTMLDDTTAGSFQVDTKNPWVTGYGTTHLIINEADAGYYVTFSIMYNQAMNTAVNPTITFNLPVPTTLSFNSSTWSTTQHYTATYLISDGDVEVPDVDVVVTNGEDPVGNVQVPYTAVDSFDVDTVAPTVDAISVSDDWIKEDDIPGTFYVNVTFSEAMNTSVIPSILFEPDVSTTLVNQTGAWVAGDTHYVFAYDIADADVVVNDVNVTVGGAEDAAGNPDPLTGESLFDIDTLHHAGVPEYIDVWADYSASMSITLNANEVAWPKEGNYSEWNSPEYALESDDEYAFLTKDTAWFFFDQDVTLRLNFEAPPKDLKNYTITSVKLKVEQKIISDWHEYTDDTWEFGVGNKSDCTWWWNTWITRPGTVEEHTMSIDITWEKWCFFNYHKLTWDDLKDIAVEITPDHDESKSGEWYIDNVWLEINYVYHDKGPSITVPVGGEAKVYANVTDWFNDTVPDGTPIHFETYPIGTVYPLTDTTTSGIAKTTIISTDVGTATVNASGSLNGICEVTFMAHTLDVELSPGWNLISVPRELENTSIEAVFDGITTITKVYTYQDGDWYGSEYDGAWDELITGFPIENIEDGKGYWVYATEPTTVTLSLEPLGYVQVIPPDYELSDGWTMIGYTTLQLEPEMPVPVYLTNLDSKWQSLYSYTPDAGYDQAKPDWEDGFEYTEIGRGYWIYLNEVGVLVP